MSEFAKAGMMGGYKVLAGGRQDPDCTHVVLTVDEYDELQRQLEQAQKNASAWQRAESDTRIKAKLEKERITRQALEMIDQEKKNAAEAYAKLESKYQDAQYNLAYQERLNANLLRISRERANADRKLKPKKTHTGYLVLSSQERDHPYTQGTTKKKVRIWETVLQTPFPSSFTEEQARQETDLFQVVDDDGTWLVEKIGITGRFLAGYAAMLQDKTEDWLQFNVLLEQRFKANYRAGYWEVTILHTKPLTGVPADMLP